MTSAELRKKFLDFFVKKGHKIIPSASLIPENDPSVLFTTAGMHPLVPYLKGEKHPMGNRLTNVQKCIRTGDIDEVGDSSHLTFFEMLGYWSLGDPASPDGIGRAGYFKRESIHYTFDFYTQTLGFDKNKINVTIFEGDKNAPFDEESYVTWKNEIGIPEDRIYKYNAKENWWILASGTGPCGPCTEMFIDIGKPKCSPDCGPACTCGKFVEISNNVFMEFLKRADGSMEKLTQKNVDVGLGFERLVMFNQGKESVFETDLFEPIMAKIERLSGVSYEYHLSVINSKSKTGPLVKGLDGWRNSQEVVKAFRIIADHVRAATFILGDEKGIGPSNVNQGYVLRRLIRRAIRYGRMIGIEEDYFTSLISKVVIEHTKEAYPELKENQNFIVNQLIQEEEKFAKCLETGLKEFQRMSVDTKISGRNAFALFSTYGFPYEMTEELAREKGIRVDKKAFDTEFKKHQELSRTASAGMFKGGLADAGEQATKYHTATHMLLAALREVLGPEIYQKGSNITAERLRFDFSYPQKMTPEQIKQVEDLVNKKIKEGISVEMSEMPKEKALKLTKSSFGVDKYGDVVKVYKIGDFSVEICGGPHVANTDELGHFEITKEEASSAGVRRIKAILRD